MNEDIFTTYLNMHVIVARVYMNYHCNIHESNKWYVLTIWRP